MVLFLNIFASKMTEIYCSAFNLIDGDEVTSRVSDAVHNPQCQHSR